MKQIQIILLVLFCAFTGFNAVGQANANLQLLTLNSGQVNQGAVVDLQVSVGNTGPGSIGVNKVRAQISIPIAIATALPTAQQTGLPAGWIVVTNSGATITVCNGTDVIPSGEQRQIFIKIQGTALGGPSTINGSLNFGPGSGVCTGPGSLPGDNTADNTSTSSITVLPAAACNLALSASAGTIACNGGTTTLTATATGAAGAVEYSLNGGAFQVSNVFTVNAAGSPYTVTVRESGNTSCTATATAVTVTEPAAITASAAAQTISCFGGTTTLTVTAAGGTAPLQYSLNGGAYQAGNTFTVSATGSPYTVTVRDANLCTATTNGVTVTQPTVLTATATATPVSTIGGSNGTATAVPVGGTSPYTYSWAPGGQTTVTATGLTAGSYTVTVTDANGCTTTASATVGSPSCSVTASAVAGPAIVCNAGTTSLTVTATGAAAPVQYSINGGTTFQASNVFTVGAGTYTVTVKDVNNCTATTSAVTITQPTAVVVGATAQPIALPGGTTTVNITATGGTAPYTGTGSFVRSAGTYTFTVTDANGCTGSTTLTLNDPTPGNANATLNLLTLNSGQVNLNGFVDLQVSVGNTGPSFIGVNKVRAQISIPIAIATALPNAQQTGLPAGWIIVTNTGGTITICNGTDQIPSGLQRQIFIKLQGTAAGGPSTINGSLSFGPGSGVCTGPGSLPGDNTADNTSTSSITVISTCNLAVSAAAGTIACNGGSTTLTATATGAAGAVEYSLNGGAFQSGNTFTVTAAGSPYTVTAREVTNTVCTATSSAVTVSQPTAISASATAGTIACFGGSATLTVTATGGTGAYQYSLNGGTFQAGNTFSVTAAGSPYTVTVRDINLCTATTSALTVSQPTALSATATSTAVTTTGGADGTATAVPAGGTAPYTYSWAPGGQTTVTATGLTAGSYTVTVTDFKGCTTTATTTVGSPSCNISASATAGSIACFGGTTTLTVTVTGATAPVQYSLNGGAFQLGNTFTVNAAGSPYTVSVKDANLCTASTSAVTVSQPTALSATATSTAVTTTGGADGTATAVAAGGTAPYTYSWAPGGQTTVTATGLTAGSYTVTVTDFKGCTTTATTTVGSPSCNISASATAGSIACFGGTTTLTVTVTGANAPVQYSLNGGAFQLGNTFTVNAAGSPYTVSVKDANLCTATASAVTVSQPSQLVASSVAGVAACGGTATVTVSATGGTAPYTGTGAFNAPAGPYTYTVTDANGCTSVTTGTVTSATDNINPTITAPANATACTNSGCTATGVNLGTPVTADNCSVASVTNNAPAAFPLGTTTVTWTVTDGSGNTATATQTVTVTDGVAPSIYLNQTGLLAGNTGTSSSASPYLLPAKPGVKFTSILSATNTVGGYQMSGIPDGLGAFDNCNGTFTLLMNHELGNTLGVVRSHGAIGSFVSKWVINKSTLSVVSGSDLMTSVYGWNNGTQSNNASTGTFAFNRFCSGDLPAVSAFYNAATGLGTKARIYMHGEEGGATGYQLGTVASGADAGKAYILGKFNLTTNGSGLTGIGAWENALASPFAQNKTIVIGNNDGGTGIMANSVAVYVGTKTNTGSEVDKAGLTNGTLSFVSVTGNPVEIVNTTTRATNITSGAAFTLSGTASTTFSRPEDGVWSTSNPAQYFFVTTDQLDQVTDGIGAQVGRSRLWRLNFADITNPALGGTIDMLLDGTEGHNMLDNVTADKQGHLILQEDVGNAAHNGKVWQYTIATDQLTLIAKHDPARFGDRVAGVTTPATAPYNADEESSGIIDASEILGAGWFLTSDQAHYASGIPANVVEGGQLLAMFNPESVGATSTAADTVRACFGTTVNLGTPATADNCSVASVTNNAPASFPVGNTTVTWTVTDGSGNTATATQVVVITVCNNPLAATFVKTNLSACGGSNDGTITVTATGGTAPYTYSWTGETGSNHTPFTAGNVSSLTGLNYGYYNVTITDANLNTVTLSNIHVEFAFAVFITASGSNTSSCGNTGSISLFGNSGVQPYTYSLDGITYQVSNTFTALAAGTYTGYVKDAAGCISSKNNIVITASAPVTVTTFVRAATSCSNDGQIQVFRSGGVPPYTYSLDGTTFQASNVFNGLAAGTYTATVKDSKGCVGTQPAVVNQGAGIAVNLGKTNTSSCTNDGTIQANAAGGVGPYTYSIDGTTFQASNAFGSLGAGTYTITVKDTKGCFGTANTTIAINQIVVTASVVNATTCSATNGSVQLFRTGGTGPYSYSINGNTYQAGSSFTGLTAGTYTGYVKDSKGCVGMLTGIVVGPTGCTPLIASGTSSKSLMNETAVNKVIRIQAYPNPSANDFTLALEGFNAKEAISVTVTDLLGRVIYQTTDAAKLQYKFGKSFIAGVYTVQVVQGSVSKALKLVKE